MEHSTPWEARVRKRLDHGRREELLDGLMRIISERGFAKVGVAEVADELHCSVTTLYKIAPSKESLVLLAIQRFADQTLAKLDDCAERGTTPAERARIYFRAGARSMRTLSPEFREDVERYETIRASYLAALSGPFIDRFVELLDLAAEAGEVRPINSRFLATLLRQMAISVRDEQLLQQTGLTAETAILEIDAMIWDGIGLEPSTP